MSVTQCRCVVLGAENETVRCGTGFRVLLYSFQQIVRHKHVPVAWAELALASHTIDIRGEKLL